MYQPLFNKRQVLVFKQFGNKGYSLFACLGREVVCSVLSVATLTFASAGTVSTLPVTTDSTATTTARERLLDEVSVTGSRAPLAKSQAARMVTVLERSDIQQAPVQSVNDLLKYAVGVDVRQRGPLGAQTDVSIRGGTHDQIIVLLNGVNICDPQTGHNTVDLPVDLSEIVRIEVIEGPAGRLYGTSSLVGAINIVTEGYSQRLSTRGHEATVSLSGGSFGYANGGGRFAIKTKQLTNSLSASYRRSDGYSRSKAGTLNTDLSGAKAFYQGQYSDHDFSASWQVGLSDKGWGSSTFYATPRWQADDQYEHTTKTIVAIQAENKRGRLHLHPTLYWNRHSDRYEGYRNQPEKMKYNYNRTDVYGLSLNSYFDWKLGRTALGAELRTEQLLSGNLGEPLAHTHHIRGTDRDYTLGLTRTNISAYAEHNVVLRRFTLSAGLVAVKNTWADMNLSLYPGIDASLTLNSHWRLHAGLNTSLRMPSFTEMYYKLQGYSADPHLKPEEMRAIEAGATYSHGLSTATLTLWHHHGRNMIDWVMDTSLGDDATWQSVNHTRINSIGLEASVRLNLGELLPAQRVLTTLGVSYSYISQEKDAGEGMVSQYAMEYLRHKLVADLQLRLWRQLTAGLYLRWQDRVGQYTDFDANVCSYKPYCLVDARIAWNGNVHKLYVEASNLLNQRHADYGHVEQPGTWITAGWSLNL